MIILGIDPGIATTGFGIIRTTGGVPELIDLGIFRTKAGLSLGVRLVQIREDLVGILKQYKPTCVAIEELFFNTNTTTAMKVAQARGVLLEACVAHGVEEHSFTPLQIKSMITGDGKADKRQVQDMIERELGTRIPPSYDDAADAVAIALCLAYSKKL